MLFFMRRSMLLLARRFKGELTAAPREAVVKYPFLRVYRRPQPNAAAAAAAASDGRVPLISPMCYVPVAASQRLYARRDPADVLDELRSKDERRLMKTIKEKSARTTERDLFREKIDELKGRDCKDNSSFLAVSSVPPPFSWSAFRTTDVIHRGKLMLSNYGVLAKLWWFEATKSAEYLPRFSYLYRTLLEQCHLNDKFIDFLRVNQVVTPKYLVELQKDVKPMTSSLSLWHLQHLGRPKILQATLHKTIFADGSTAPFYQLAVKFTSTQKLVTIEGIPDFILATHSRDDLLDESKAILPISFIREAKQRLDAASERKTEEIIIFECKAEVQAFPMPWKIAGKASYDHDRNYLNQS